ncbi:MAG: hypothetical protein R3Y23_00475 [Bacillota bacterium]
MENNTNNIGLQSNQGAQQSQGKWVAVDANTVGNIPTDIAANQPFQGADGAMYCMGEPQQALAQINSNVTQNAVPVPSSIVQMPPIVQPIALVPFTSQNQPLLQYDPYSRPVEPQVQPAQPEYKLNPYKGNSLAAMLLGIVSLVLVLFLSMANFAETASVAAYSSNGLDMIFAVLAYFGLGVSSSYYTGNIEPNLDSMSSDIMSAIIVFAVPVCIIVIALITLILVIKNLVKLAKGVSPKCFSIGALVNIILIVAVLGFLLGMNNAAEGEMNIAGFFSRSSSIYWGIGLAVALVLNIVHIIIVALPKKNNYIEINK